MRAEYPAINEPSKLESIDMDDAGGDRGRLGDGGGGRRYSVRLLHKTMSQSSGDDWLDIQSFKYSGQDHLISYLCLCVSIQYDMRSENGEQITVMPTNSECNCAKEISG